MPTLVATSNSQVLEPWIDPEHARTQALQFAPSLTVKRGALISQITASGLATHYTTGASNGSEKWLFISRYDFTTDANGLVTLGGPGSVPDRLNSAARTELVFWRGAFRIAELSAGAAGAAIDGTTITIAAIKAAGPEGTRHYGPSIGTNFGPFIYIP